MRNKAYEHQTGKFFYITVHCIAVDIREEVCTNHFKPFLVVILSEMIELKDTEVDRIFLFVSSSKSNYASQVPLKTERSTIACTSQHVCVSGGF